MKMLKRVVALTAMVTFLISQNIGSLHAYEGGSKELFSDLKLEKGKTEMYVSMVRVRPGKMVAIVRIPIKSKAKLQGMFLESPSGIKYKAASMTPMPYGALGDYLDSASAGSTRSGRPSGKVALFFIQEAYADSGSCGGGAGHEEGGGGRGVGVGVMGLIKRAGKGAGEWITACVFDIVEEAGSWIMGITFYDEGKHGKVRTDISVEEIRGTGYVSGPGQSHPDFLWLPAGARGSVASGLIKK